MKNQRGFITVDFIFAIVMVLGFTALLFVMTFSLMVSSVTQYITFASARNYVVAHLDEASQEKRATEKYQQLISNKVFKPLYSNGWFKVDADPTIGDQTKVIPGFQDATQGVNEFWGVGTHFVAPILDFQIPFFGSTVPGGDGQGLGFTTYIGSYLGREPSADECIQLIQVRWEAIRNLPVTGAQPYSMAPGGQVYFPQTDDGC